MSQAIPKKSEFCTNLHVSLIYKFDLPVELRRTISLYIHFVKPMTNETIRANIKLYVTNRFSNDLILQYGKIEDWDTSEVSDMSELFLNASEFNADISEWDVSNVTNMNKLFFRASSFNQPIGKWNVANVSTMKDMFLDAVSFNQPIAGWNVSNVTIMSVS